MKNSMAVSAQPDKPSRPVVPPMVMILRDGIAAALAGAFRELPPPLIRLRIRTADGLSARRIRQLPEGRPRRA